MKTALLVVDVQSYFVKEAPDGFATKIADHISNSSYDFVGFTIFRNTYNSNFVKSLGWEDCQDEEDTKLANELSPFISTTDTNVFSLKYTYSAMQALDLQETLRQRGIEEIVLCGIDTDACVLATAFEAFDLGYKVNVLFDLCHSTGNLTKEAKAIISRNILSRNPKKEETNA
jgi:nicotinamidase-related amidase